MAISKDLTNTFLDSGTGGNITLTKPTGSGASHILILSIGAGRSGGNVGSYNTPTGWNLIGQIVDATNVNSNVTGQVYWSLGDNANVTFTASGTIDTKGYACVAFLGCDLTTPIDATGTPNNTTTDVTTLTTNAVTVVTDQAWNTTPKGTGSTGTVIVTSSGAASGQVLVGVPFALRPAAGGSETMPIQYQVGGEPATSVWDWAGAYKRSDGPRLPGKIQLLDPFGMPIMHT